MFLFFNGHSELRRLPQKLNCQQFQKKSEFPGPKKRLKIPKEKKTCQEDLKQKCPKLNSEGINALKNSESHAHWTLFDGLKAVMWYRLADSITPKRRGTARKVLKSSIRRLFRKWLSSRSQCPQQIRLRTSNFLKDSAF